MEQFATGKPSQLGIWMGLLVGCETNIPSEIIIVYDYFELPFDVLNPQ
jgi:hypothetical protein